MLLQFHPYGIYCPQADVFIDPWKSVPKAIITHGHADHAKTGSAYYLAHHDTIPILKLRLGADTNTQGIGYNETVTINGVHISLHPAGHIIGSAQIRLEYKGEIWVVSGDYKLQNDGVCPPFEPVRCHHFVTESTFGLPVYNFPDPAIVHDNINNWWRTNNEAGKNSVIIGYSLGKAQRIMKHLDPSIGKIITHGAVHNVNQVVNVELPEAIRYIEDIKKQDIKGSIIVAPPSTMGTPWMRRFEPYSLGICSGWMQLRGSRRRRNADMGFVLSDHADWNDLNTAVKETGAENIYVTHGYKSVFAKWLRETQGLNAIEVDALYEGDESSE
ncbi:MAG: ligase-associated DNA damage response exonuclease [Bacteroidia bacterium]|nr:ligase-associated DNA damage response exonuclease [Bacteroidia bacterium]